MCVCVIAGSRVALTLLSRAPAGGGPPSLTPQHLAEPSRAVTWTHTGPLIGNPVLDREKISAPQAVDVCLYILYTYVGDVIDDCRCVVDGETLMLLFPAIFSAYPIVNDYIVSWTLPD